jgi:hypothetical protein
MQIITNKYGCKCWAIKDAHGVEHRCLCTECVIKLIPTKSIKPSLKIKHQNIDVSESPSDWEEPTEAHTVPADLPKEQIGFDIGPSEGLTIDRGNGETFTISEFAINYSQKTDFEKLKGVLDDIGIKHITTEERGIDEGSAVLYRTIELSENCREYDETLSYEFMFDGQFRRVYN